MIYLQFTDKADRLFLVLCSLLSLVVDAAMHPLAHPSAVARAAASPNAITDPLIGPEVFQFGNLPPITLIYHPTALLRPQSGLPAPDGYHFEGPDPGLNANIIGGTDCPNSYRKDTGGICRLEFTYGPNPFSAIIPKTYKGSIHFYMGLQVTPSGRTQRRRFPFRLRGRPRNRFALRSTTHAPITPVPSENNRDDDDD